MEVGYQSSRPEITELSSVSHLKIMKCKPEHHMKQVEFCWHWNWQAISYPDQQGLEGQILVQKPAQAIATNKEMSSIKNEAFMDPSINRTILHSLPVQEQMKPSITEKTQSKALNMSSATAQEARDMLNALAILSAITLKSSEVVQEKQFFSTVVCLLYAPRPTSFSEILLATGGNLQGGSF